MDELEKIVNSKKLGKYEIIKEIGRGNMAVVFLGNDPFINRQVAVKIALPHFVKDKQTGAMFRKMFFNEARIAGMLDNRFILPVYDAGIEEDLPFIVMEYVDNCTTLKDYSSKDKLLPIPKVLEIIYKCCRGLDYAHSRDVIHKDIKPTNILLTAEMDVRVADFGIAQILRPEETQMQGLMGSPRYMSPEQISEQPLGRQTDIFSLGVVLFELLTGTPPFEAKSFPALSHKIVNEESPLLQSRRADIPDSLELIMKRALAKRPDSRYPNCMDLASDLLYAFKHQVHVTKTSDITKQEKFKKLRSNRFFRDFFDSELWEVVEISEWSDYRSGDFIITEDDIDNSFYILCKGKVLVKKGDKAISSLSEGDCFGEMAYVSKTKRTASIVADGDVILIKLNSTLVEKTSTNCNLRFMKTFLQTLIERLSAASNQLTKTDGKNQ